MLKFQLLCANAVVCPYRKFAQLYSKNHIILSVVRNYDDHDILLMIVWSDTDMPFMLQEAQLMLANSHHAFISQSRSPNIVPFLCNSNFVFKILLLRYSTSKKCCDLEIHVRGHSRSL